MKQIITDEPFTLKEAILKHQENLDLIPSNLKMSSLEMTLVNVMSREYTLKRCIYDLKKQYDYILIDCSPFLGMITVNVLATSDEVIHLALSGMVQTVNTINQVKKQINPNLSIAGILSTFYDRRTNLSKNVRELLYEEYSKQLNIFDTYIPVAIKTAESSIYGKSILSYDKNNPVSKAYNSLALEVISSDKERFKRKNAAVR